MDRFLSIEVFVQVAECGSFSEAARKLAMSPPAVTRAVALLEDRIGSRLFIRTTRSVRLSESGERFYQDGKRILLDLKEAEDAAIGTHVAPRGEVRITAPVLFGRLYVTPILGKFIAQNPFLNAQTLFVDRVVNMMDEGMDIAIRIGELPDSSLSAIRVGSVRRCVFSSPSYLEKAGVPMHPKDLSNHTLIQALAMGTSASWDFQDGLQKMSVLIQPRFRMNTNDSVIDLVRQGRGISRLLSYQIAPYLQDGQLQLILNSFEREPLPVHVLHQEGRRVSGKVRACVDFMVEELRGNPNLNYSRFIE
jgi:DNA-binding transcriptional LysR family regulator